VEKRALEVPVRLIPRLVEITTSLLHEGTSSPILYELGTNVGYHINEDNLEYFLLSFYLVVFHHLPIALHDASPHLPQFFPPP
jgi:hypothetical protein